MFPVEAREGAHHLAVSMERMFGDGNGDDSKEMRVITTAADLPFLVLACLLYI